MRGYAVTFSFSFKAALRFNGKVDLLWRKKCFWAKHWNSRVPRESALRWSIFVGAEVPVQPSLPGGRDSQLRPLWRKAAWTELLLSWGVMAGYFNVNLFSTDISCLCGEVENFQEVLLGFLPPMKFILGEVSSARAWVLQLGGYTSGTRNQAFIACLSGGARAGGLLSVYVWRLFHTESLKWIVIYYWT